MTHLTIIFTQNTHTQLLELSSTTVFLRSSDSDLYPRQSEVRLEVLQRLPLAFRQLALLLLVATLLAHSL